MPRTASLALAILLVFTAGCDASVALGEERERLERQLIERQVVLADLELFRSGVEALERRRRALRAQLGEVNLPLLAQGLNEEQATGRLEQRDGEPDVIVMSGPGPAARAASAVEQAALRAPGLRVRSLTVDDDTWVLRCVVDDDLPQALVPAPAPPTPEPMPWQRGELWDEVLRLRAAVAAADASIGVDVDALGQQRWEADLLEARMQAPSRLRQVNAVVAELLAGARPVARGLELSFTGERGQGRARLLAGTRAAEVQSAIEGVTVTDAGDGSLEVRIGG
jgi:hypothetical protein